MSQQNKIDSADPVEISMVIAKSVEAGVLEIHNEKIDDPGVGVETSERIQVYYNPARDVIEIHLI